MRIERYQIDQMKKSMIGTVLITIITFILLALLFFFYPITKATSVKGVVIKEEDYYVKVCFKISSLNWYNQTQVVIENETRESKVKALDNFYTINEKQEYLCGLLEIPLKEQEKIGYHILDLTFKDGTTTLFRKLWH